ncbi:small multi-drug export protein [Salinicoccus cyprini]|uniref:Small multi-drug export protein n=1 Tax=Salinicoccus cyprini TaxID=2493691 RepID=A0A558AYS4_9STAP|nr:small multi-drug export protein [Salinicoccus cyprini]TVT29421.1 small multi-drug export protein [Salinicoccus cyprini]
MNTSLLIAYIIVFLLSAIPLFEAFVVVPVGIIGGMNFIMTLIIGILGNLVTLFLLIILVDRIKQWYLERQKRKGNENSRKSQRAEQIWKKYGLPGLAFIGPFFVGSHFTALMALILGGSQKATFFWVTLSVIAWTVGLSILVLFGVDFMNLEDRQFLSRFIEE